MSSTSPKPPAAEPDSGAAWPSVTIVYVVYNRRAELRESLRRMLDESDYPRDRVDAIVVDNASSDGSAAMVRDEFPDVGLIARERNIGAPAWNDGFAAARGDYVLILDDDCYLPPDGLRRAVEAAGRRGADLVSFSVVSTRAPGHVFTDSYRTGLFAFWGCAWLVRREVVQELGGYDPALFMWGNELEFMLRFFDRGHRHLHLPEVAAQHMSTPGDWTAERGYRMNARRFAYVAARHLRARDAAEALLALLARDVRDGLRVTRTGFRAIPDTLAGFAEGLRRRTPLRNAEISRCYRRNFETFASPWWLARPPREFLRRGGERPAGRRDAYFRERAPFYPDRAATLDFRVTPR